ncbi:MAG: hypothetical protein MJ093_02980 [Saccharofermentans sp.]|nr:hypothetical protein [Saccharofermentans sp.]
MSYDEYDDVFTSEDAEYEDYEEDEEELRRNGEEEGCYIATSVYGSYDCPQVWVLRHFRDDYLKRYKTGRAFIHAYYFISPKLVKLWGKTSWFNKTFKGVLDPMVNGLKRKGYRDSK